MKHTQLTEDLLIRFFQPDECEISDYAMMFPVDVTNLDEYLEDVQNTSNCQTDGSSLGTFININTNS